MSKPKTERHATPDLSEQAPAEPVVEVEQLALERDALRDQLLRAMADMQNFRRRIQQEKEDTRRFATENLVSELLPILDNFERTIAAAESGAGLETLKEGVAIVDKQLRSVLENVKLERIPAVGLPFDPERHEAVSVEASDLPEGTVLEEVSPGYRMAERVLRPTKVRIAKKP